MVGIQRLKIDIWIAPAFLVALLVAFFLAPWPLLTKLHAIPFGIDPQRPSHSYFLGGTAFPGEEFLRQNLPGFAALDPAEPVQPPLEARKIGMYLGFLVTWFYLIALGRGRAKGMPPWYILLTLVIFVGIMGFDGFNAFFYDLKVVPHLYAPRLDLRLGTGSLCGVAFAGIMLPVVNSSLWRENDMRPIIKNWNQLLGALAVVAVLFVIVASGIGIVLYPLAILMSASVLILIAMINMVFVLSLAGKEGSAVTLLDALNPFAVGIILAIVELGVLSLARFAVLGTAVLP